MRSRHKSVAGQPPRGMWERLIKQAQVSADRNLSWLRLQILNIHVVIDYRSDDSGRIPGVAWEKS